MRYHFFIKNVESNRGCSLWHKLHKLGQRRFLSICRNKYFTKGFLSKSSYNNLREQNLKLFSLKIPLVPQYSFDSFLRQD